MEKIIVVAVLVIHKCCNNNCYPKCMSVVELCSRRGIHWLQWRREYWRWCHIHSNDLHSWPN